MVVQDRVGLLQQAAAFGGDEFRIARTRADQVDLGGVHERTPARSYERVTIPAGTSFAGRNRKGHRWKKPAESRLQRGLAAPQSRPTCPTVSGERERCTHECVRHVFTYRPVLIGLWFPGWGARLRTGASRLV